MVGVDAVVNLSQNFPQLAFPSIIHVHLLKEGVWWVALLADFGVCSINIPTHPSFQPCWIFLVY
jgi:hypothetical protein